MKQNEEKQNKIKIKTSHGDSPHHLSKQYVSVASLLTCHVNNFC